MRTTLVAAFGLGVLAVLGCGARMPASASSPLAPQGTVTHALPKVQRRAIDGRAIDTRAPGKVVVVKFFATYCEPCKQTLPWFEALAKRRPDVLFVGIDPDERAADVEKLVADYGLTFPVVHDAEHALVGRFRVSSMPVTFVADPAGRVRWVGGPGQHQSELESAIEASKRPASP